MEVGGEGVSVYAEAKAEYTQQLCQYLVPSLHKFFLDLLDTAKGKEPEPRKLLLAFQQLLEEIADWNVDKVQRETGAVISGTRCDYLEDLLTAVFIAHTKVLSAIRLTSRQKKLQINIPKLDHFVHRSMTECARLLWTNTYLFSTVGSSLERQKNHRQIESFITEGVLQGIRGMLPVKSILREYLNGGDEDDKEDEADNAVEAVEAPKEEEKVVEAVEAVEAPAGTEAVETAEAPKEEEKVDNTVEAVEAPKEEEKVDNAVEAPVATQEGPKEAPPPTLIVDTSPQVTFTGINSVFDGEDSVLQAMNDDEEDGEFVEDFQVEDGPPEPLTDFETIGEPAKEEPLAGEELPMDFETL